MSGDQEGRRSERKAEGRGGAELWKTGRISIDRDHWVRNLWASTEWGRGKWAMQTDRRKVERRLWRGASQCFSNLFLKPHFKAEGGVYIPWGDQETARGCPPHRSFPAALALPSKIYLNSNQLLAAILVQAASISYLDECHSFLSMISLPPSLSTTEQPKAIL